jgi:acetyl-CoA synthetase
MQHPAVQECAVTGVPDEERGYIVKATVVLCSGYCPSKELKDELKAFVKEKTAPYKYPRIIDFAYELPKTISGKVRRVEIRESADRS